MGTAKKGAAMTDLGVSKAIEVRFEGIQQRYLLNPRVIRELHTDLNLSNLFLKKVKAKMDFSMDRTVLTIGNENTELIQELGVEREKNEKAEGREPKTALVHCLRARNEVLVKANTLTFVKIRPQKGMIQVSPIEDATCQAINALYENTERVALLNLGEEHRRIRAGDVICTFAHIRNKGRPEEERVAEIPTDVEEDIKIQRLWQQLNLDTNTFLRGRPDLQERVWKVLKKFHEVFASETRIIGETSLIQFEVELILHAKPYRGKVRPLNPEMKKSLRDQIDLWVREGVAEECLSPWARPMVPVAKSNGTTRWCVDYRKLNASTMADSYPFSNISENLD